MILCIAFRIAAGQTQAESARQLAAAITGALQGHGTISITMENRSSLDQASVDSFRQELSGRLMESGIESAINGTAVPVTVSENIRGLLATARLGEKTWIVAWTAPAKRILSPATLSSEIVWSQTEPILDVLIGASEMLLLEPGRVSYYRRTGSEWKLERTAAIPLNRPMPRDPRGRLMGTPEGFQLAVPGTSCSGSVAPALTFDCSGASGNLWVPDRNYQRTAGGDVFSMVELRDGAVLTAGLDGKVRTIRGSRSALLPGLNSVGSDIAALPGTCGAEWVVSGAGDDADSLTAMSAGGLPVSRPLSLNGPVTALWPDRTGVMAVVRNLASRTYDAFKISITCAN